MLSPKPIRICLFKSYFAGPISGADETICAYAEELQRAGYDVKVTLLYPFDDRDHFHDRLERKGIRIEVILKNPRLFEAARLLRNAASHFLFIFVLLSRFPGHIRKIWQSILNFVTTFYYKDCLAFVEQSDVDVIHIFTPDSGSRVMIRAAKSAGVVTVYHELGTPQHQPGLESSYAEMSKVTPDCSLVAALSPRLARQWTPKLPNARSLEVIPLAVSPPRLWAIPLRQVPFDIIFGFAGRIEAAKGPMVLLDAFAEVIRHRPSSYLRMAGTGPQLYKARAHVQRLGLADKCEFPGHYTTNEGRAAFFGTLSVFVLPTFAEGTPNSVIEALSAGVPVIASGVGGLPDMITPDCGILVPPGEPGALAAAMLRIADDPSVRLRMGRAARARYEALFAPDVVIPSVIAAYNKALAGHGGERGNDPGVGRRVTHPWTGGL